MNAFYLDPELGNDIDNTPYGWWKVAFTGGSAPAAVVGEQVQGATSGSTAFITYITLSGGSWAGNNASGTMYFYGKSAGFVSEQVNFAGGGHLHIISRFCLLSMEDGIRRRNRSKDCSQEISSE